MKRPLRDYLEETETEDTEAESSFNAANFLPSNWGFEQVPKADMKKKSKNKTKNEAETETTEASKKQEILNSLKKSKIFEDWMETRPHNAENSHSKFFNVTFDDMNTEILDGRVLTNHRISSFIEKNINFVE